MFDNAQILSYYQPFPIDSNPNLRLFDTDRSLSNLSTIIIKMYYDHDHHEPLNNDIASTIVDHHDKADKLAKQCVGRGIAATKTKLQQFENEQKQSRCHLQSFFCMRHKMNRRCLLANNKGKSERLSCEPTFMIPADPNRAVSISCQLPESILRGCPLGETFGKRLCAYFDGLYWDFGSPGISIHEFFADFTASTGTTTPVLCHTGAMSKKGPKKTYNLADHSS